MTKKLSMLLLMMSALMMAADVTGKWTSQVPGRDGATREQVITLKADGDKLTGTISGMGPDAAAIEEGKVTGDNVSFKVTREMGGNKMVMSYTGTVAGDEIKFKREGGRGAQEFVAKRAK